MLCLGIFGMFPTTKMQDGQSLRSKMLKFRPLERSGKFMMTDIFGVISLGQVPKKQLEYLRIGIKMKKGKIGM